MYAARLGALRAALHAVTTAAAGEQAVHRQNPSKNPITSVGVDAVLGALLRAWEEVKAASACVRLLYAAGQQDIYVQVQLERTLDTQASARAGAAGLQAPLAALRARPGEPAGGLAGAPGATAAGRSCRAPARQCGRQNVFGLGRMAGLLGRMAKGWAECSTREGFLGVFGSNVHNSGVYGPISQGSGPQGRVCLFCQTALAGRMLSAGGQNPAGQIGRQLPATLGAAMLKLPACNT